MSSPFFRNRFIAFCLSVTVYLVLRNTFSVFVSDNAAFSDDLYIKNSDKSSDSIKSRDAVDLFRQFAVLSGYESKLNKTTKWNKSVIVYKEKSDKNHTLLRANMSHVGAIVRQLHEVHPANVAKPHPFKYILNCADICGNDKIFVLVYIHTAPDHFNRRMVIRKTWGKIDQYKVPVRLIFVMGVTKLTENLNELDEQQAIVAESDQYGDIVQEDFLDSYHNLTHKGVAALRWITNFCKQAVFILKTDDDIFVNTYTLIRHLQHLEKNPNNTHGLLMCAVWYGMPVMRTGKWKVTKDEWKNDSYPTYCSGSAFVLSTDVAITMYKVSYHVPFFWVDDFYITGLLPLKAGNITHRQFLSTFVLNGDRLEELFTGPQWYSYIFSHVHDLKRITTVWEKMSKMAKGIVPVVIRTAMPGDLAKLEPTEDPYSS